METAVRISGVALIIILGVFVVLLPGCMGFNYAPVRDIIVIKLDANGIEEWVRTIDGGQDDVGEDMAELANGELVIVGQNGTSRRTFESPRVIRLSSDGKVIADRTDGERFDRPRAVVADPDGGFAVQMQGGELTRYDRSGTAVWTCTTAMWEAPSLTRLRDGGYLAGGYTVYQVWVTDNSSVTEEQPAQTIPQPVITTGSSKGSAASLADAAPVDAGVTTFPPGSVSQPTTLRTIAIPSYTPSTMVKRAQAARYTADGQLVWQRTYAEGIAEVWSTLEDRDGSLLLAGPSPRLSDGGSRVQELIALRADGDSVVGPTILLGYVESKGTVRMRAQPAGIEVLYSTWSSGVQYPEFGVASTLLDPTGQAIGNRSLKMSQVFNETSDGGYVSVGVPVAKGVESYESSLSTGTGLHTYTTFHALRLDFGGNPVWNHPLSLGTIREVKRVIQTADGGYAILATTEKG